MSLPWWYFNGIAIVGEIGNTIDITGNGYNPGDYQVVFNYGTNCILGEVNVTSLINIEGENIKNNILIYPNNGIFTITGDDIELITVSGLNGRIIFVNENNTSINTISLSNNSKGIYFVKIIIRKNTIIEKIIIK